MTVVTIYIREQPSSNMPWIKIPKSIHRLAFKFNGKLYSSFVGYDINTDISKCRNQITRVAEHYLSENQETLKLFEVSDKELALYKYSGMRIPL